RGMSRATHDGDAFDEERCPRRRDARRDRIFRRLTQCLNVRHVIQTENPFALPEFLIEHRRTDYVLLGVRIETTQPVEAGGGRAGALQLTQNDRAEYGAHRAAGNGVANDDLAL